MSHPIQKIVLSASVLLFLASCGGGGGDAGPNFGGLTSGTAANEITSVRVQGTVSEDATIVAQNGDVIPVSVADSNADTKQFDIKLDLDDVDLPVDPKSADTDWDIEFDSDVSAKILSWYFRIEAEK